MYKKCQHQCRADLYRVCIFKYKGNICIFKKFLCVNNVNIFLIWGLERFGFFAKYRKDRENDADFMLMI